MDGTLSRRSFVTASGSALGSAWLAAHWPAILAAAGHARRQLASERPLFGFFDPEEAAEVEAIAAAILPSEPDGLGAREAGVVHFIDRALQTFLADQAETFRAGLEDFRGKVSERFAQSVSFASLDASSRTAFLHEVEDTPFFGAVWFQTVLGTFADPSYGGNRDQVGWRLLGFENRHVWQPPFGWYDREAHGG